MHILIAFREKKLFQSFFSALIPALRTRGHLVTTHSLESGLASLKQTLQALPKVDFILTKSTDYKCLDEFAPTLCYLQELAKQGAVPLDPLNTYQRFTSRSTLNNEAEMCLSGKELQLPNSVLLSSIPEVDDFCAKPTLQLPLIAKPNVACGNDTSHRLTIIRDISQLPKVENLFVQELISHSNDHFFKCYFLDVGEGEFFTEIGQRRSIGNLVDSGVTDFDTQSDWRPQHVEKVDHELIERLRPLLSEFASCFMKLTDVHQIGADVVYCESRNVFYIIDINYFPTLKTGSIHVDDFIKCIENTYKNAKKD